MLSLRRMRNALRKAIEVAGGQSALAKAIGVTQPHIWNWLNRDGHVPVEYVFAIEKVTGVPCWDLRPDIWPPERFAKEAA